MRERSLKRRDFLASGLVALGAIALGPGLWRRALADLTVNDGPYGPLNPPDANGLMLPDGFTSRVIACSVFPVLPTLYFWHIFPDGGATFATDDGGWIYVSNSEVPGGLGGVSAIRFAPDGDIVNAYRICGGTSTNCSGGATPWNTWLSCEEIDNGRVWECDPWGLNPPVVHDAMGVFKHEAASVDPVHKHVYLTEDDGGGCFYRFIPDAYPDLSSGELQVAQVASDGATTWHTVPDPSASSGPTQSQVPSASHFSGGEGTFYDDGHVYFTTKGDNRVWDYDTNNAVMSVLYDDDLYPNAPLHGVDNTWVSKQSGDLFVAEDGDDLDIVIITPEGAIASLLKVTGAIHNGSELTGPAMDPSGTRLYFSSQRGKLLGVTYEVSGPFRNTRNV